MKKKPAKQKTVVKKKVTKQKKLTFETADWSRDDVAKFLLQISKKRQLVNKKVRAFQGNNVFRSIYDYPNLQGILLETITKIVNSFEVFILKEKGRKRFPKNLPTISNSLNLKTSGMLTGYLIRAYDNNISKDYKKYKAGKRTGEIVSIDTGINTGGNEANESNDYYYNKVAINPIDDAINESHYKQIISEFLFYLREYDKKTNQKLKETSPQVSNENTSQLAYLFINLLKPQYKGKFVFLKERFPYWNPYMFKLKKDAMIYLLKREFPNKIEVFFEKINREDNASNQALVPAKRKDNYFDQSCDVQTFFEILPQKKGKAIFKVGAFLYRLNNGRKEILKKCQPVKMEGEMTNQNEIKELLNERIKKRVSKLKDMADLRKFNYNKSCT